MNWSKLSAVAEVLSSIAIIVTLVYLAIQTEQNTIAIRTGIRQETLAADLALLVDRANNPERLLLWCQDELTEAEKYAVTNDMMALIRMREAQWLQYQDGVLDERTWTTYRDALGINLSHPRTRVFWERISQSFLERGFVASVNELLDRVPISADVCSNPFID